MSEYWAGVSQPLILWPSIVHNIFYTNWNSNSEQECMMISSYTLDTNHYWWRHHTLLTQVTIDVMYSWHKSLLTTSSCTLDTSHYWHPMYSWHKSLLTSHVLLTQVTIDVTVEDGEKQLAGVTNGPPHIESWCYSPVPRPHPTFHHLRGLHGNKTTSFP